jgi:hypothetical protein
MISSSPLHYHEGEPSSYLADLKVYYVPRAEEVQCADEGAELSQRSWSLVSHLSEQWRHKERSRDNVNEVDLEERSTAVLQCVLFCSVSGQRTNTLSVLSN